MTSTVCLLYERPVRLGRNGSETPRSPPAAAPTDRHVLRRRRRRRSQFATAAAAALQAAVSRAAAAAVRPRFCASARRVPPTLPPVTPVVIKPEQDSDQRDDEFIDVDQQATVCDSRIEHGRLQTSSVPGSRYKTLFNNSIRTVCSLNLVTGRVSDVFCGGVFRNLKGGVAQGYISGVHFQKCSNFSKQIYSH